MVQRVLAVSFAQVLRSIAILLLPLAFIALIAWTTAGSASGNTSDPIRAALWLWLGAHHIPFSLVLAPSSALGFFSYLPIGAILLPVFAIRYGFKRAIDRLDGNYQSLALLRLAFSFFYALLATGIAWISRSDGVKSVWYFASIFTFLIAFFTTLTCGVRVKISRPISFASRVVAILLGISFIYFAILIFLHLSTLRDITLVLQPGFFGAILLFILNVLYLPNAALAVLSYFAGSGFAVGADTIISPFAHTIGTIPAFPLLAAVPTTSSRWALLAIVGIFLSGCLLASWSMSLHASVFFQSLFFILIFTSVLGFIGGGSLMTDGMGAMGLSTWKFTLNLCAEIGAGALALYLLPRARIKVSAR